VKGQRRPSSGRYGFTTWNYFNKDSKLIPSGLLGPVRVMAADWNQTASSIWDGVFAEPTVSAANEAAFEAELPKADVRIPVAGMMESTNIQNHGGASDASPLFNGTTRNGSGGAETLDDGKTFRSYAKGDSLLLKIDGNGGRAIREIQTFAGHRDQRASQAYSVWIAKAGAPESFTKIAVARVNSQGGSTRLRVPVDAENVVAVRFDFADGPLGVNVYREICLLGTAADQTAK
jgi:hypothetical protein